MVRAILLLLAGILLLRATAIAEPSEPPLIPNEHLFASSFEDSPQISADGSYLAFLSKKEGVAALFISLSASPEIARFHLADAERCIVDYLWAGNTTHLVLQVRPSCTFNGMTFDGYTIFSLDIAAGTTARLSASSPYRFRIQTGENRPSKIQLARDSRDPRATIVTQIDIRSGAAVDIADDLPSPELFVDRGLEPRLAARRNDSGGFDLLARTSATTWQTIDRYAAEERHAFKVLGFSRQNNTVFLLDTRARAHSAVVALNVKNGGRTVLFEHPKEDVRAALFGWHGDRLLAVQLGGARTRWIALDPALGRTFAHLRRRISGDISIVSRDRNDRYWVIRIDRDIEPSRHLLLDRTTGHLRAIPRGEAKPHYRFAAMRPVTIPARDGLKLPAYLTLPVGFPGASAADRMLPMVVLIHGGPAMHVVWGFDPEIQWLANRGYAVLAVNFRGSTGFGPAFTRAGHGEWGGAMQRDVMDAVDWAIRQGIADPRRIAVMGHSYGGYATLMGLSGPQNPFACGISLSGPTDLSLFLTTLESFGSQAVTPFQRAFVVSQISRYQTEILGAARPPADRDNLADRSPLHRIQFIKAPVLLIHGQRDLAVIARHSLMLFERLAQHNQPAALLLFADEGHVIRNTNNVARLRTVSECFLARCLGGRSKFPSNATAFDGVRLTGELKLACTSQVHQNVR